MRARTVGRGGLKVHAEKPGPDSKNCHQNRYRRSEIARQYVAETEQAAWAYEIAKQVSRHEKDWMSAKRLWARRVPNQYLHDVIRAIELFARRLKSGAKTICRLRTCFWTCLIPSLDLRAARSSWPRS
jgi:hypothetical protein